MNLQPRRVDVSRAVEEMFRPTKGPVIVYGLELPPSIWRMELPNTSYAAPQAAFWWVSNERVK